MGSGAPKNISSISQNARINILAAEGLVYDTHRKLTATIKQIFAGDDNPQLWQDMNRLRLDMESYSRQYTTAIFHLQKEQGKA